MTNKGFTIIEIVIAIIILSAGLIGLVSTSALITRMVGQGHRSSTTSFLAQEKLELLRSQSCSEMVGGAETRGRYNLKWEVFPIDSAEGVWNRVIIVSPNATTLRTDTFVTVVACD